jgi:DNA-binding transcriptional MerR regulator
MITSNLESKSMSLPNDIPFRAIQLFEPEPNVIYSIEATERITHVPRRMIAVYCKHGLVSPVGNPNSKGFYFDGDAIKILRRLEAMRAVYSKNLADIKMILSLLNEMASKNPAGLKMILALLDEGKSRNLAGNQMILSFLNEMETLRLEINSTQNYGNNY